MRSGISLFVWAFTSTIAPPCTFMPNDTPLAVPCTWIHERRRKRYQVEKEPDPKPKPPLTYIRLLMTSLSLSLRE